MRFQIKLLPSLIVKSIKYDLSTFDTLMCVDTDILGNKLAKKSGEHKSVYLLRVRHCKT